MGRAVGGWGRFAAISALETRKVNLIFFIVNDGDIDTTYNSFKPGLVLQ